MAINGIDFITNYYSIIGVSPEADEYELHRAIREKRAGVHPDRLLNVDPQLSQTADRIRGLIDEAASILNDPERKLAYDKKLKEFQENKPELVSENGQGIIEIGGPVEHLMIDKLQNDVSQNHELDEKLRALVGYSEDELLMCRQMYSANPDNQIIRDMYKRQLGKKLAYIKGLEQQAWSRAGIENKQNKRKYDVSYPEDYLDALSLEILRIAEEEIPNRLSQRTEVVAIGMAPPLRMLVHEGAENPLTQSENSPETVTKLIQKQLTETFLNRTKALEQLTNQKAEIVAELLQLTDFKYLNKEAKNTNFVDVMLTLKNGNKEALIGFLSRTNLTTLQSAPMDQEQYVGKTVDQIDIDSLENDTIIISHNPEIEEVAMELTHVIGLYIEKRGL